MVKKRTAIRIIGGFAIGVLAALLCFLLCEKIEENARFKACLARNYSLVDLTKSNHVETDIIIGTTYCFSNLEVIIKDDVTLFFDHWSGQIRQYTKGVLFSISVAEYDKHGISYKNYQIRTKEECETISQQVGTEKENQSALDYRIWKTASGEVFID